MNSILPSALETRVTVNGRRYTLRPTVAHVLAAMDAIKDEDLLEADRLRLAVWHLYRWPRPRRLQEAVQAAFEALTVDNPYRDDGRGKQAFDITQDAALIVAAFRQQYGIDLPRESLRMDWRLFLALLSGITGETRLGEVESIRVMDIPKWTPYNGEQRREIMRLKQVYAIRNPAKRGQSMQDGLRGMVEALLAMAGEPVEVEPEHTEAGEING